MERLNISILGEDLIFDFRRTIFWPKHDLLLATDLHWGKSTFLQRHGIAVSDQVMDADLQRLGSVLRDYRPKTLMVLGDLIHHEGSLTSALIEKISLFRHHYPCELVLIKGNHDRFTDFPEAWGIIEENDFILSQFYFTHDFRKREKRFQFTGHLHPMVKFRFGPDYLRLPAFILGEEACFLPAFSHLTGGFDVRLRMDQKAIVVHQDGLEMFSK